MNSIMRDSLKATIYYSLGVILLIVIFQIFSMAMNDNFIVPSVGSIFSDFFILLTKGSTYSYIGYTLLDLVISLLIAILIGVILGSIAGIKPCMYKVFKPIMSFFRILPVIVLILMVMLYSTLGYVPMVVSTMVLIPVIHEGVYQGIIKVDKDIVNAYRLDTAFNLRVLFNIYLPLIGSSFTSAAISALGLGIKVVVTAEYICGSSNSLGRAIINCLNNLEYSKLYAYSIILIILILLIELIPRAIASLIKYIKIINKRLKS